jgi:phytoene desaturase
MSLFVWYFGTKRKYDDVAHHTILLGPRYKDLLNDIFERKVLADDFSLYLHRPTLTDPSMAPEGLRRLLRAVAGAAPGQRRRLDQARRVVPPPSRGTSRAR